MKLTNNSLQMKTQVETFIVEETAELIYDNEKLDKWYELVSSLDLKGQTKITSLKKSPIPFLHLKRSMVNVFTQLCPLKVNVEDYDVTPIPIEILDLIALSKNEKYFQKIEIWYDEKSPDPVCVGVSAGIGIDDASGRMIEKYGFFKSKEDAQKVIDQNNLIGHKPYDYSYSYSNYYLLGKWADVKYSFEELKQMATERFINEQKNKLQQEIKEKQRELDDIEKKAFEQFN